MTQLQAAPPGQAGDQDRHLAAVGLTEMEEQILAGLAEGKTGWQICQELGISRSLYYYHVHAVRRYFRVRTTVEAVVVFVRQKAVLADIPIP